jgi:hypothetical protein
MKEEKIFSVTEEVIISKIYMIREQKVMLDEDLAELYGVETRQLKRAVRRNGKRFPPDFMFVLDEKELEILRCQSGTSRWGGTRYLPMAFTEQGVAMLSSVLSSEKAILVNIRIIRIFSRMRELLMQHKDIVEKLSQIEHKLIDHDDKILLVFEYLKQLEQVKHEEKIYKERTQIGFRRNGEK